jgi:hypothetical protein
VEQRNTFEDDKDALRSPYTSMWGAGNEQYHAVCSINEHGPGNHQRALEEVMREHGYSDDDWKILNMANYEVNRTRRIALGERINKEARARLDAEAAKSGRDVTFPSLREIGKLRFG